MSHHETLTKDLSHVGEAISHELGAKMVKDFQDANPEASTANFIGRNIIEKILAQPGCTGIRFYNALNESGRNTLVYVGVDASANIITEYVGVNTSGELVREKGIVADRAGAPAKDDWDWWQS